MGETWIVFKADEMSSPGWEARRLMPSGNLMDILWENWDYGGQLPPVGERVRDYALFGAVEPEDGVTHGRDGDCRSDRGVIFPLVGAPMDAMGIGRVSALSSWSW